VQQSMQSLLSPSTGVRQQLQLQQRSIQLEFCLLPAKHVCRAWFRHHTFACAYVHVCILCHTLLLVRRFVSHFDQLLSMAQQSLAPLTVAVVGGGAGGVELALALAHRLRRERGGACGVAGDCDTIKCAAWQAAP
jgi:hypothetical protein